MKIMMTNAIKIIGLETSGNTCGVALFVDGKLQSEYSTSGQNMHDKLLAEFTRRMIIDNELNIYDINAIAISAGPGSFTGLRIGASFAKGICFENQPKLIAVPTLDAMAFYAKNAFFNDIFEDISVIISSHKDLVYYSKYDKEGNVIKEVSHLPYSEIQLNESSLLIGKNPINHQNYFREINSPQARYLNELSYKLYNEGKITPSENFEPFYVQEFIPKKSSKKLKI